MTVDNYDFKILTHVSLKFSILFLHVMMTTTTTTMFLVVY